ncbi:MAG TPA: hypothetical protein VFS43_02380 [Polyangiaceae bacterium]|nr:hypothetical protein [Polyangiaceae bacterium]
MARLAAFAAFAAFAFAFAACRSSGGVRGDGGDGSFAAGSESAASGEACRVDEDCATGFCDRDQCASPQPEHSYGRPCTAGAAPAGDVDAAKLYVCGAYLCRDARCRSCADDAECRADLDSPHCVHLTGRPGRRCGAGPP